ncbi:MAG: hypothetical protein JST19_17870 [Bacteroidetes bacterium]|nr:hypothetical protein [Bacteroidota bacterium]
MKYFVFILSLILFIAAIINLVNIDLGGHHLSRFGYGYITGKIVLILILVIIMFLSGRSILRKNFNDR